MNTFRKKVHNFRFGGGDWDKFIKFNVGLTLEAFFLMGIFRYKINTFIKKSLILKIWAQYEPKHELESQNKALPDRCILQKYFSILAIHFSFFITFVIE